MSQIDVGGVVKGGLAAALVMIISEFVLNVPLAGDQLNAELAARNLPPVSTNQIAAFVVLTIALGVLTVWLYAAIRPRLGAGPKTAITAGIFMWACVYLNVLITMGVLGFHSMEFVVLSIVWTLIEMILASSVGGYLYTEASVDTGTGTSRPTGTGTGRQPVRRPT